MYTDCSKTRIAKVWKNIGQTDGRTELGNIVSTEFCYRLYNSNIFIFQSAIAFRNENERRKTFEGFWSDTWPVSPKTLAQAGFYYLGETHVNQQFRVIS